MVKKINQDALENVDPSVIDETSSTSTQYLNFMSGFSGYQPLKASSTKLTFKPSIGNLGVGGSAYSHDTSSIDVGDVSAFYTSGSQYTAITCNSYASGANNLAKITGAASRYLAGLGTHTWQTMASVTAGAIQTPTNTLVLDAAGNLTATANVTAYSDERLKKNWESLPTDFVERLSNVKNGTFDRTDYIGKQIGVSAQSLRELSPESVVEGSDGMLSVSYGNAALAACVELAKEIVELKECIREMRDSK